MSLPIAPPMSLPPRRRSRAAPPAAAKKDAEAQDDDGEDTWLQIWVDFEAGEESGFASASLARDQPPSAAPDYRAFTTAYDREASAASLVGW
jgi:hypothetical protein